jgi:hypothetical protein
MSKKFKNRRPTSNPYANPPSSENISEGSAIGVPDTIAWGDMMISKDATPEMWQKYANRLQAGEKPPGGYPTIDSLNLPAQRPALRGVPPGTIREPLFGRNKDGSPKPRPPGMTSEEVAALSAAQERKYNPPQKTTKASSAPRTPPPAPNPSRSLLPPATIPQTPEKQLLEYQARINSPKFAQLLPRQQETLKSRASALQEQISTKSTAPRPVPLPIVPAKSAPARDMYGNEVKLDDMVLSGGMKGKLGSKLNTLSRASNVSGGGSTGTNTAKPTFRFLNGEVISFGNTGGGGTTEETEPVTGMR